MARRRAKRSRASWRLPRTVARVVPDHRHALSIARSKRVCSGCRMRIIRPLAASRLIPISALAARSALAKVPTVHSWMVVPGTRSRWYPLKTGKACTESRCRMLLRPHLLLRKLTTLRKAALDGFGRQGRLLFYAVRTLRSGCGIALIQLKDRQVVVFSDKGKSA